MWLSSGLARLNEDTTICPLKQLMRLMLLIKHNLRISILTFPSTYSIICVFKKNSYLMYIRPHLVWVLLLKELCSLKILSCTFMLWHMPLWQSSWSDRIIGIGYITEVWHRHFLLGSDSDWSGRRLLVLYHLLKFFKICGTYNRRLDNGVQNPDGKGGG